MNGLWGPALAWPTTWENELRRLFDLPLPTLFGTARARTAPWPPLNVWVHEHGLVVQVLLPGVDADSLDVTVQEQVLRLSGERKQPELPEGATVHMSERPYGKFVRSLRLPFPIATDAVKASYTGGVLRIELPRHEQDKPRRIKINTQGEGA